MDILSLGPVMSLSIARLSRRLRIGLRPPVSTLTAREPEANPLEDERGRPKPTVYDEPLILASAAKGEGGSSSSSR